MDHGPLDRRRFLYQLGSGLGSVALSWLLAQDSARAAPSSGPLARPAADPLAPRAGHLPARARRCIFLLMEGGPSQVDTFDPKPALERFHGKPLERKEKLASSQTRGERFLLRSPFSFARYGACGMEVSELFRETAACADDIALVRSVFGESDNHPAALFQLTTGSLMQGSPSMGSWAVYGLGTENQDLPAFVVLRDGRPFGGTATWSNGYLPASFQGTQLRSGANPILDPRPPAGVSNEEARRNLDLLQQLNRAHSARLPGHPDLEARTAAYELAFRMQAAVPDAVSLAGESEATRRLYGLEEEPTRAFGQRCLLARRLVERGVRFVQVWSGGWDSHDDVAGGHRAAARRVDRPIAGLLQDLKQRGLLDETLVIWGGEFGRTPDTRAEAKSAPGRDHNPGAMAMWFAGGGVRGGTVVGATDDFGNKAVERPYHLRDVHATFLHLLGLDQSRLVYYHGGRFKQLTDTGGELIREIL
jgi:hypothetical protein